MFTISPNYFRDRLPHPGTVDTVLLYYQYHIAVVTVPYLGTHNDSIDRLVKVTDIMSNVLGIKNNAPLPQSGKAGGQMSHSYTYDPLYRLASATGTYRGTDNKTASYTLAMGYDNMHRITSKKQHLSQTGVQFDGTLNAGYELAYTYQKADGKKFQLDNVRDINYRTEETPTESTNINNGHKYTYDANGNLVYINTSRVKKDGKEDEKATEQKYRWDEENRLLAADENGFVSNYWYDADGERTVKTSGENEAIYVNSEFSGGNTGTARFSLYVSPYLVAGQGGKYTKHIYIGSQRIVSKLGDLASYGADPRRIPYAGNEADGLTINYKDKYAKQLQSIKDNYKAFDQPYNGKDNDDYVNGQGFCCNDATPEAAQARAMARTRAVNGNFKPNDDYEKMQFFYHPDHLGSSSYITNLDGEVAQHIEYVPFGEVFIEERNNTWNTPYLFNAKEFDEETGMYYYGARYYEPRLSLWMSTDALQERYYELSSYAFCHNNPVIYVDPDGNTDFVNEKTSEHTYVKDNVNQVIMISNSDYQLLASQKFDQNTKEYASIIAGGIPRTDLFPTVENVLAGKAFVPYSKEKGCFKCASEQNNSSTTGPSNRIDLFNKSKDSFNYTEGVDYIKSQLIDGKSVLTGVSYGENVGNQNPSTSHFLNIVGMGFESGENGFKNYFMYYDNANRSGGTNLKNNRFYQGYVKINDSSIPVLYDNTNLCVVGATQYIVTEVRRNR